MNFSPVPGGLIGSLTGLFDLALGLLSDEQVLSFCSMIEHHLSRGIH